MKPATKRQSHVRDLASNIIGWRPAYSDKRKYGRRFKWIKYDRKIVNLCYELKQAKIEEALKKLNIKARVQVHKVPWDKQAYILRPFLVIHVYN